MRFATTEADVVERVEAWLREQGYDTRLELQWRPLARTDLVGWKGAELVGIECKLRNWKAAIAQAMPQTKAFDRVYVAAVYAATSPTLQEILDDECPWTNCIGVLGVTHDGVRILREASGVPGWPNPHHRNIAGFQFVSSQRESQKPYAGGKPS